MKDGPRNNMTLLQPWMTSWLVIMHMRLMKQGEDTRGAIWDLVTVLGVMLSVHLQEAFSSCWIHTLIMNTLGPQDFSHVLCSLMN